MLATRTNPFAEIDKMLAPLYEDEVKKDFDYKPNVNIAESEDHLKIYAELPGVDKKDVKVSVNDENILTIKGNREMTFDKDTKLHKQEYYKGAFKRAFIIPKEFDTDKIDANFNNGILEVKIDRKESVKPKEISIK